MVRILLFIVMSILLCAGYSSAGPASPEAIELSQPDGTAFSAKIRGDEFQNWVETSQSGHTIVKNSRNHQWEYAERQPDGTLMPSGFRVMPNSKNLPAFIKPGIRPERNVDLETYMHQQQRRHILQRSGVAPDSVLSEPGPEEFIPPFDGVAPAPVSGAKNLLIVLVNFSNRSLITTASSWYNAIFSQTAGVKSVSNFFLENSFGKMTISPAPHTQPGNPAGVVSVTISDPHPNCGSNFNYSSESTILNHALAQAAAYIDFAGYDSNANNYLDLSELVIYFVYAGYEASGSAATPNIWAHAWGGNNVTAGGKYVASWALNGELNNASQQHPMGVIAHELGHSLCGLPDLYDTSNTNAGMGHFSLMAGGSWGFDTGEYSGSTPVALDAWSREYLGWTVPTVPASNASISLDSSLVSANNALKLLNSSVSTSEYWLAENRYTNSGWDRGLHGLLGGTTGGLLITHIDNNASINRYVAGGHQGVMVEQASTSGCNMATTGCRGNAATFFSVGTNASFGKSTVPNSNYWNNVESGLALSNISAAGPTMTLDFSQSISVGMSSDLGSPQNVATTITFTAAGSGGTGSYEYEFWLLPPGGTWAATRAYSSTATWAWNTVGRAAGAYQVGVRIRAAGTTPAIGYDTYKIITYTLNPLAAVTGSTLSAGSASPQTVGSAISFSAGGTGGTGSYEYEFWLLPPGGAWAATRAYSSTATWTWNTAGSAAGTYQVGVRVKTAGTSPAAGYDTYKTISYTLNPLVATLSANVPSPQTVATAVTLTAGFSGGSGSYEYEFWLLPPGGAWAATRAYSSTATWTWNTAGSTAGTYQVGVRVKTAGTSPAAGYDTYRIISYTLNPLAPVTAVSLSADVTSPQNVTSAITFTAGGTGGTGNYEYEFWLLPPGGAWAASRTYGSTATWTWNTAGSAAGTYQVGVRARTAGTSPAAGYDTYRIISYTLNPLAPVTAVSLSADATSPQNVTSAITFTAGGTGGTGNYEYEFWLLPPGGAWAASRTYGSTATWTWNTAGSAAGTYQVGVRARTAGTSPAAGYDTYRTISYTLNPLAPVTAVSLSADVTSPQNVTSAITFTAGGTGGTGNYEYEFWLLPPGGAWAASRTYGSTATWTWNTAGSAAGTYQVGVRAKTAGTGPAIGYDTYKIISYTLNPLAPATSCTLTAGSTSPQPAGSSITFTSTGSGGTGNYEYEFWLLPPGGTWGATTAYGSTGNWTWNTTGSTAGTYQVGVRVKTTGTGPPTGYDTYKIISFDLR